MKWTNARITLHWTRHFYAFICRNMILHMLHANVSISWRLNFHALLKQTLKLVMLLRSQLDIKTWKYCQIRFSDQNYKNVNVYWIVRPSSIFDYIQGGNAIEIGVRYSSYDIRIISFNSLDIVVVNYGKLALWE